MTSRILIKNVYYMLSYAFKALKQNNYEQLDHEDFDHVADLFAAILGRGISQQLKQGLHREYRLENDNLITLRGKLDMRETIRNRLQKKHKIACEYDELTPNNLLNQILKTTSEILLKQQDVKVEHRNQLKRNLMFFGEVDSLDVSLIPWNRLQFQRSNVNYQLLINICYLVLNSLLMTETSGKMRLKSLIDEQEMSALYERFVLEYYIYHYPDLGASPKPIDWILKDENVGVEFLPKMKTDITLTDKSEKTLIIDTKYYSLNMQQSPYSEKQKFISSNLYQIFAYVKNTKTTPASKVAGMLLYAKTTEDFNQSGDYQMNGNRIMVKTLDLNQDFVAIAKQLDNIVETYFLDLVKTH